MNQIKFVSKLFPIGILSFALGMLEIKVALARPITIPNLTCVRTGSDSYIVSRTDLSINREFYTSFMQIRADQSGSAFTCKLPNSAKTLVMEFGKPDGGAAPIKLDIYLDGNQVASRIASPGQTGTLAVDITNGKSLGIETSCVRARGCEYMNFIYFFKAQIELAPTSPGRRN